MRKWPTKDCPIETHPMYKNQYLTLSMILWYACTHEPNCPLRSFTQQLWDAETHNNIRQSSGNLMEGLGMEELWEELKDLNRTGMSQCQVPWTHSVFHRLNHQPKSKFKMDYVLCIADEEHGVQVNPPQLEHRLSLSLLASYLWV